MSYFILGLFRLVPQLFLLLALVAWGRTHLCLYGARLSTEFYYLLKWLLELFFLEFLGGAAPVYCGSFEHDLGLKLIVLKVGPDVLYHKIAHQFEYFFRIALFRNAAEQVFR